MDTLEKLVLSATDTRFEANGTRHMRLEGSSETEPCGLTEAQIRATYGQAPYTKIVKAGGHDIPIHMAAVPGGRRFPLLKVMLTTACERNCYYCPFRAGRNHPRVTFKPEELSSTIMLAHQAGWIEGVFLSTGLFNGGANTQNKLLDTALILRRKYQYPGYLHIKIMPGAEYGQVLQAMQLADRVSTNLEAPNAERLEELAPQKDFEEELLTTLRWAEAIRQSSSSTGTWRSRWPSTTTQFVVGAASESDLELLSTVENLYQQLSLKRVYFEAFSPVVDTPMERHPPESTLRQQRLYEASFLLRDYGFCLEELPFAADGGLPREVDPKQAYADRELRETPVELNLADRELLLRVPGIGPKSAGSLLAERRRGRLQNADMLRHQGLISDKSMPYILLNGRRPTHQLELFSLNKPQ